MSVNFETVSEKVYNILTGKGFSVNMYDKEGQAVIDPQDALDAVRSRIIDRYPNSYLTLKDLLEFSQETRRLLRHLIK